MTSRIASLSLLKAAFGRKRDRNDRDEHDGEEAAEPEEQLLLPGLHLFRPIAQILDHFVRLFVLVGLLLSDGVLERRSLSGTYFWRVHSAT